MSPRVFRVLALPAPTEREKSQMYVQRYLPHLPAAGEVVIWDRSWYNRAGVERVMGFCTEEQAQKFLAAVPLVRLLQGAGEGKRGVAAQSLRSSTVDRDDRPECGGSNEQHGQKQEAAAEEDGGEEAVFQGS